MAFHPASADPAEALVGLEREERWERDWIATATVRAPKGALVTFAAVVLAVEVEDAGRLSDAAAEGRDPTVWLAPTAIVQADDPDVVAAALEATAGAVGDAEKVDGILAWMADHVGYTTPRSLDASVVLDAGGGSCTGPTSSPPWRARAGCRRGWWSATRRGTARSRPTTSTMSGWTGAGGSAWSPSPPPGR